MSIYASLEAPHDDHAEGCAVWVETEPSVFERGPGACSCRLAHAPLAYQGSHVLPEPDHERGGWVDLALIPSYVRNPDFWGDWPPEPYLRFGVNQATVVLDRAGVQRVFETLRWWLEVTDD